MDLLKKGEPPVKAEVIRALSARSAGSAVATIVALAGDQDRAVRSAAFLALGGMAGEKEMPALLGLLVKATTEEDRTDAGKAISATCARAKDKAACASAVLAAMDGAPAAARGLLLRVLPLVASDKSLTAARAAMKDGDELVRDAALRARRWRTCWRPPRPRGPTRRTRCWPCVAASACWGSRATEPRARRSRRTSG